MIHGKGDINKIFVVKFLGTFNVIGKTAVRMEWVPYDLMNSIRSESFNDE